MATSLSINDLYSLILGLQNDISVLKVSIAAKVSSSDVAASINNIESLLSLMDDKIDIFEDKLNGLARRIERLESSTPTKSAIITYSSPVDGPEITTVTAGNSYTTTYTNPDYPRRLVFTEWSGFDESDTFTITGTDFLNVTITDTISYGDTHSTRVFKDISEINLENLTSGSVKIGWSNDLSLSMYNINSVYEVRVDGTIENYDDISTTYGWIRFITEPNGSHNYTVYLTY